MDFLLMSYLFFAYNLPVPYIAAGSDFLNMGAITKLLRESGAYFIRRSFRDDPLYTAVFEEYTKVRAAVTTVDVPGGAFCTHVLFVLWVVSPLERSHGRVFHRGHAQPQRQAIAP
jgi:hypothetical protein